MFKVTEYAALKQIFFLVIALCKFGHRKFAIATSFKLRQLIEETEQITW